MTDSHRVQRRALVAVALLVTLGAAAVIVLPPRSPPRGASADPTEAAPPAPAATYLPAPDDAARGLRCIRGGTSREEVRTILGEPDSIVFGDWLYGRSSIAFGYGVVLDYDDVDGNLRVCP